VVTKHLHLDLRWGVALNIACGGGGCVDSYMYDYYLYNVVCDVV